MTKLHKARTTSLIADTVQLRMGADVEQLSRKISMPLAHAAIPVGNATGDFGWFFFQFTAALCDPARW
jgi:hypothetical protein